MVLLKSPFSKTNKIDAMSLVSIIEHESGPNTGAIMLPSSSKNMKRIIDLREVKKRDIMKESRNNATKN